MKKRLTYEGWDKWDRAVYRDEDGNIWKDINPGGAHPGLCDSTNNDFDGEPGWPMPNGIEVEFIPERKTWR